MVRYFDGKMCPEYRVWDSEGCFVMENLISIFQHSTCACSERTLLLQKICTLLSFKGNNIREKIDVSSRS